jgi:hypothetical protein
MPKHARKPSYVIPATETEWYSMYSSPEHEDELSTDGSGHESRTQGQYIYPDVANYAEISLGYKVRSEPRPRSTPPLSN